MRSSKLITLATLAFALTAGTAQAADLTPAKAEAVADALGDAKTAGTYLDAASDEMVIAVTDQAAAEKVEAAGGIAKVVEHSTDELEQVKATVDTAANVPGMAWAIDPEENKVVITVDASVDAAELRHVQAGVAADADAVRIERVAGTFSPYISGGHAITTGGSRCSLGFNVRDAGGAQYFLTAGHCTNIGATWSGQQRDSGTRIGTSFPGNDYGIVRYTSAVAAARRRVPLRRRLPGHHDRPQRRRRRDGPAQRLDHRPAQRPGARPSTRPSTTRRAPSPA